MLLPSTRGTGSGGVAAALLDGARREAPDQLLLEDEEQDHQRDEGDDGAGQGDGDLETWVPSSCFRPICTVSSGDVPPVATSGHRYWFQAARKENTASAASEGRASGTATRVMNRRWP